MITMGIDPSTASTGLVVLMGSLYAPPVVIFEESFKPPKKLTDMPRVSAILGFILAKMDQFKPESIAIEAYGLNFKRKTSIIPLVTLGGVLRYYLVQEAIPFLSPSPSEHKRFITGNGNTPKDQIPKFIAEVWGHTPIDGDCADAYGLACMALAHRNALADADLIMREVAGQLKFF